jgi:hypothetical protein
MVVMRRQIKEDEMGSTFGSREREEKCVYGFDGEIRRKRPLGTSKLTREDNIRMDLQ